MRRAGKEAAGLLALSLALALAANLWRAQRLDLLHPYEGLTPQDVLEPATVQRLGRQVEFLDVRSEAAFRAGHIPRARNWSWREVEAGLRPSPVRGQVLVVYCDAPGCGEASEMAWELQQAGYYRIYILGGGLRAWTQAHLPLETAP